MLEHAAEPEFILAGMTPEQLKCFSSYIEKQKVSSLASVGSYLHGKLHMLCRYAADC
jgi:hypothetical protein